MKKNRLWTKEEEALLRSLAGKMSYKEMEKYFDGRAAHSLKARSTKKLKIKNDYIHKKYTKNELFWEVPNPINCYWAGFIAADGCLNEEKINVKIELSIVDLLHLERFKEQTEFTGKIIQRGVRYSGDETSPITLASSLSIHSCKKWIEDMKKNFNLCQNKTKILQGPNLSNDYLKMCYLLGFLDGDGCLCWSKNKNDGYPVISFISSSLAILNWVKEIFDKYFNVSFLRISKSSDIKSSKNHFVYKVIGLRAAKFFEFASVIDVPKLDRKWKGEKFLKGMEEYKAKRPIFFTNDVKYSFDENGSIISPDFKEICAFNLKHIADRINLQKPTISGR